MHALPSSGACRYVKAIWLKLSGNRGIVDVSIVQDNPSRLFAGNEMQPEFRAPLEANGQQRCANAQRAHFSQRIAAHIAVTDHIRERHLNVVHQPNNGSNRCVSVCVNVPVAEVIDSRDLEKAIDDHLVDA